MKKLIYWVYWGLKNFIPILPSDVKSPGFLDYLSKDKDSDVRWWVALNPNTSPKTLDYLSKDEDYYVRWWVVRNSNTTSETLKQMSIDEEDIDVKYLIKIHPNCSEETWKYLSALEIIKSITP
jgi:hypothetical protein